MLSFPRALWTPPNCYKAKSPGLCCLLSAYFPQQASRLGQIPPPAQSLPGSVSLVLTTVCGQRPKEGWRPATSTGAPKVFSGHSLTDEPWPGSKPPVTFLRTEEGPDPTFPKTIPLIQQLLNATEFTQNPSAYSQLVAVMVYTAERAKFSTGVERQDWMQLFIDTFKLVHRDITGDPESALTLC